MKTLVLAVLISTVFASALVWADAPRCGNNSCYCYVDPDSKSIVCRRYP